MQPIRTFSSRVVPLIADNVDTDQIIPARFLKVTTKVGLGDRLFADWRYEADGTPKAEFVLNAGVYTGQVLLSGSNFGSGSSREHAPWALTDYGFRAVIARSFADIFQGNALKNGLLPIELGEADHAALVAALESDPSVEVTVDLEAQEVTLPGGAKRGFEVDSFARHCLLQGLDELGYLQGFDDQISAFEAQRDNHA